MWKRYVATNSGTPPFIMGSLSSTRMTDQSAFAEAPPISKDTTYLLLYRRVVSGFFHTQNSPLAISLYSNDLLIASAPEGASANISPIHVGFFANISICLICSGWCAFLPDVTKASSAVEGNCSCISQSLSKLLRFSLYQ